MCEFCLKHGEGKKWYLQAKNYSEDLLSDVRRRRFIEGFATQDPEETTGAVERMENLEKLPRLVRGMLTRRVTRKMKKIHYGQVVPIEDLGAIPCDIADVPHPHLVADLARLLVRIPNQGLRNLRFDAIELVKDTTASSR